MAQTIKLDPYKKGEQLSLAKLTQRDNAITTHLPIVGSGGIVAATMGGGGTSISLERSGKGKFAPVMGTIISGNGPNGETLDATDYRYWVRLQINQSDATNNKFFSQLSLKDVDANAPAEERIVCAYHLPELKSRTHSLPVGLRVLLAPIAMDQPKASGVATHLRYQIIWHDRVWAKISSSTSVSTNIYDYTVQTAASAYATSWSGSFTARNVSEIGNTSTNCQMVGTINPSATTCGAKLSVKPIATGRLVQIVDWDNDAADATGATGTKRLMFACDNDFNYHS